MAVLVLFLDWLIFLLEIEIKFVKFDSGYGFVPSGNKPLDWLIFFLETEMKFVKFDSGYGFVPSGNKPLLEPMLTRIYVAIWRH